MYAIVLLGALLLYVLTCAPTVLWQDSGLLIYRIWNNDLQGNLGLAVAHPLYILIGIAVKCIPFGELAWKINLISAFCGAVAVANLFLLVKFWLESIWPAVIGAITLAVSWTFWQHAVIAEVYTLFAAQMFGELLLLLLFLRSQRLRYVYMLALLNGLAIANHLWALFALICYIVLFIVLIYRKKIGLKHFIFFILLWMIGASVYEYLIISNIISSGRVQTTLASAFFGTRWRQNVLNTSVSTKIVLENIIFILLNFPTPNFILLFVGLFTVRKASLPTGFSNVILALLILHFTFAFRYNVPDRYAFFLPFYCLAALLIAVGSDFLLKRSNSRPLLLTILVLALLPIPVYYFTPALAKNIYKPLEQRRQRPYRDEYVYFLQPWKTGYRGVEQFAKEALDAVEENAVIYADTTTVHALLYMQQVRGKRKDVRIVSDYDKSENASVLTEKNAGAFMNNSALYVVSPVDGYCPAFLLEQYDFIKKGVIWKAVKKKNAFQ
ncbi:protein O-mannosyl-transferase family [Planctomycetota bacterium]